MKQGHIEVQADHLAKLASSRKPVAALAELIWNSLDADATDVHLDLEDGPLGGVNSIRVSDNGTGIPYEKAETLFSHLGGSWKAKQRRTPVRKRFLHGKSGEGRFKALALGRVVDWDTQTKTVDGLRRYRLSMCRDDLKRFDIGDLESPLHDRTGTVVTISELYKDIRIPAIDSLSDEAIEQFALYLRDYPNVRLFICSQLIDPSRAETHAHDYKLPPILGPDGVNYSLTLSLVEWRRANRRAMYLCDERGFPLHELAPSVRAPGFSFTAYLRSPYFRSLERENAIDLVEMDERTQTALGVARIQLKEHFRRRQAQLAREQVEQWKRDKLYPYSGEPRNPVEESERQVFDIVALQVAENLPDFFESSDEQKKLSFELLKVSLEQSPSTIRRIFSEVLRLPKEKQNDFAELLEHASLSAMISASRTIMNRLDFLKSLDMLLFEPESKARLKERKQLHRLLVGHTWLFGEEFNISVDDETLTTALSRHLELLGKNHRPLTPVLREDGRKGVLDLMLSRRIERGQGEEREHLVVELKRPSVKIDMKAAQQVLSYARAVAADERFWETKTKWTFWAVSNEVAQDVQGMAEQPNRAKGIFYEQDHPPLRVWIRTWGQLIQECEGRLSFYQRALNYKANQASAKDYLVKMHSKLLPEIVEDQKEN